MNSISFGNIYLIFLAVPLIVFFTVPFVLAIRKDNRNGHNVASYVLHLVMSVVIAFAATSPTVTAVLTKTEVYVVADVSYSAHKNLDTVDNYIKNLALPSNSTLGLVVFGSEYELVSELGDPQQVGSVKEFTVDTDGTDIVGALDYTGTLFDNGAIKRIVLITDGRDTDMREPYSLKRAVDRLEAQNIKVDTIYLDDNLPAGSKEVQLSYVDFTAHAYIDSVESATAVVQSGIDTNAVLSLFKNGELASRRSVSLAGGVNNIALDLDTSESGSFDYTVTVESESDTSALNNVCSFTQTVTDEFKVLFITGVWEECTAAVDRYAGKVTLDIYENDESVSSFTKNRYVNNHSDIENLTIHRDTNVVPFDIEELSKYDEIIISDTDIMSLANYTEFVRSVDKVVSAYGKSFVTMGNLGIQSRDYLELKQLQDMLPVRFGNSEQDPRIFTLIIDSSRSMETLSHLIVAKQVANALVELLAPEDQLCIITFSSDVRMGLAPTPIKDFAEGEIAEIIDSIDVRQGTLIGSGLKRAYEFLQNQQSSDKQVMLITDGLTYSDEKEDALQVVLEMYDSGIVTSVFDVGRQGDKQDGSEQNDDPVAAAAKQLLQNLATAGHGNYYYSNNLENMDEVTFGKISDSVTNSVVQTDSKVTAERRTDGLLDGIITDGEGNVQQLPDISGYVVGNVKASANTVLSVEQIRANSTVQRPLYAYWKYGNGKVACFTSAFSGDWVANWTDAHVADAFFDNLLNVNIPDQQHRVPFTVNVTNNGSYATVEMTPGDVRYGAQVTLEITSPDGEHSSVDMDFNASYYYAELPTPSIGKYTFDVILQFNNATYTERYVYYLDYKAEHDEFAVYDPSVLHSAVDGRGSVSLDGNLDLQNNVDEVGKVSYNLAMPLFIVCAALFLVDVAVRKLKWKDVVSFFRPNRYSGGGKQ